MLVRPFSCGFIRFTQAAPHEPHARTRAPVCATEKAMRSMLRHTPQMGARCELVSTPSAGTRTLQRQKSAAPSELDFSSHPAPFPSALTYVAWRDAPSCPIRRADYVPLGAPSFAGGCAALPLNPGSPSPLEPWCPCIPRPPCGNFNVPAATAALISSLVTLPFLSASATLRCSQRLSPTSSLLSAPSLFLSSFAKRASANFSNAALRSSGLTLPS